MYFERRPGLARKRHMATPVSKGEIELSSSSLSFRRPSFAEAEDYQKAERCERVRGWLGKRREKDNATGKHAGGSKQRRRCCSVNGRSNSANRSFPNVGVGVKPAAGHSRLISASGRQRPGPDLNCNRRSIVGCECIGRFRITELTRRNGARTIGGNMKRS